MRHGKQRNNKGGAASAKGNSSSSNQEFRKSTTPIVVICNSNWTAKTESFCSKSGQWQVIVHNPDIGKWWDRLLKNSRVRHGPPEACHLIMVHEMDDGKIYEAVKLLGESTEIATVALVNEVPRMIREELETAMPSRETILAIDKDLLLSSYTELRRLWTFQDAYDSPKLQSPDQQSTGIPEALKFKAVPWVCDDWSPLKWRWNGRRLQDLYQRLRRARHEGEIEEGEPKNIEIVHKHRRDLEAKALSLLADPDTERVADCVLSGGAVEDENLFGRVHAWALSSASRMGSDTAKYLIVAPSNKKLKTTTVLNAHDYSTVRNCTMALEQLKYVSASERPDDQFCIPVVGSAMMTISLTPALFPTGIQTGAPSSFDSVLGSQRIWEEHSALRASILYLFQGSPGPVWDLTMQVVRGALPRTWGLLMAEPPDEDFLRALLHPDVVEAGRLSNPRTDGTTTRLLPSHFEVMSRVFAFGRFVRTLEDPDFVLKDTTTRRAVARTMKISQDKVEAIVLACKSGPMTNQTCEEILQGNGVEDGKPHSSVDGSGMTTETKELLGMLGLFLNRDRKSQRDANRFDDFSFDDNAYATSKALADCAMYCGSIRWISEEDDEEGIWTCVSCLHRWQKVQAREAYQTRKLMHPMKMTPFTREEYYDGEDWDAVMEATRGNIARLGIDFYWGRCSSGRCCRVCPAVARSRACAETDGLPLYDFPETVDRDDGKIQLRRSLEALGALGPNNTVTANCLEKYFDSEEKLTYLAAPVRRRVRNCIDKSTYLLPRGLLCDSCGGVPEGAIDEYCPYCGTGFEPVFACVHFSCPHCSKHFCKACLGIDGIHYNGVYNASSHVCWGVLGNRYAYYNKGMCGRCDKERPWPQSHALVSAGPAIRKKALQASGEGMPLEEAIQMQSSNLKTFTDRYQEGRAIFLNCSHLAGRGSEFCSCGPDVNADAYDSDF